MGTHGPTRREFIQVSAVAAAGLVAGRAVAAQPAGGPVSKAASAGLERRVFGRTDMKVTVLGFGGAEIGYQGTDQAVVDRLLNAALDAGLNVVDTAECYIDSEVQIGKAIGSRRKEYYIFTKCGHVKPDGQFGQAWDKDSIIKSLERSLKRLNTEAVDLFQLHSCGVDVLKKGECIEALEECKKAGKTRYIGYSGDREHAKYAVETGRFDALQTSISICDQEAIELTLPLASQKQMGVIAKRPIANAVWRHEKAPDGYNAPYWTRLQELKYDFATGEGAKKEGPDGPAGVAMRFTAMQPGVSVLIVGTSKPERWGQNAELMRAGALAKEREAAIRARWKEVAKADWVGQT